MDLYNYFYFTKYMRIKRIKLNHHKVLKTSAWDLVSGDISINEDILKKHHADIVVEIEKKSESNFYTYLIGENGVGKSILFRTLSHFVNRNTSIHNERIKTLIDGYVDAHHYYDKFDGNAFYELMDWDIWNQFAFDGKNHIKDFLKYHQAYMIHVNSSFGQPSTYSNNERFIEYSANEYQSTSRLFLSAIRYSNKEQLLALSKMIGKDSAEWNFGFSLTAHGACGFDDNSSLVLLKRTNGIDIFNLINTIEKIEVSKDERINDEKLTEEEKYVFASIYNSKSFEELFLRSQYSLSEIIAQFKSSKILIYIKDFIKRQLPLSDNDHRLCVLGTEKYAHQLNIRYPKDIVKEWERNFIDIHNFADVDIALLLILNELKTIDINIEVANIPLKSMSSGEQSIIRIYSIFANIPVQFRNDSILFLYDEPENSLHPIWQQNFPYYFQEIVENIYSIKKSHFIFATHSPLIIMKSSSVPNSNVLKISKDEDGILHMTNVKDIYSYSVEELLLDQFNASYRSNAKEREIHDFLHYKFESRQQDPIETIKDSFALREKINDLFKRFE